MIRTGYEQMVDPGLDARSRADELTSCGVLLPHLLEPLQLKDLAPEPSGQQEIRVS